MPLRGIDSVVIDTSFCFCGHKTREMIYRVITDRARLSAVLRLNLRSTETNEYFIVFAFLRGFNKSVVFLFHSYSELH